MTMTSIPEAGRCMSFYLPKVFVCSVVCLTCVVTSGLCSMLKLIKRTSREECKIQGDNFSESIHTMFTSSFFHIWGRQITFSFPKILGVFCLFCLYVSYVYCLCNNSPPQFFRCPITYFSHALSTTAIFVN